MKLAHKRQFNRRFRKGFTLAEALMASALLAMAAAGVLLPFTAGANAQKEGVNRTAAASLATDMMQIIEIEKFDNIITLYDGYVENKGQVEDASGAVITDPGYSKFSRSVSCAAVYTIQQSGSGNESFILVKVQVCYDDTETITLKKMISR